MITSTGRAPRAPHQATGMKALKVPEAPLPPSFMPLARSTTDVVTYPRHSHSKLPIAHARPMPLVVAPCRDTLNEVPTMTINRPVRTPLR